MGFVPTMGALHAGHAKLLETARRQNDIVVASIFVNPLQFDRKDDLEAYPRTMQQDLGICAAAGVELVFAPTPADLYPHEQLTFVESPALSQHLCGEFRPGHFRGVATVVLKLFNIVQPDRAYFGEKDAQQLAIIRRMVADLNVPVTIVSVATVREPDGLAFSSRNKHLTLAQRAIAPVLSGALGNAVYSIDNGERSADYIEKAATAFLASYPEVRVEHFKVTNPGTLAPVQRIDGPVLIAAAIWLGATRLIDNVSWPGANERK
ncbi:MAG: pantoate--beta-alanine ligase [Acidobacteriota bacterium]|nr:pantoate--beta-alanine ligase [Acidobacteriota bacterium]